MADLNMVFAGFGGQGILFLGKVCAYAGLMDGKEVSWLPSYGPEMRGGTANCSVCLSNEPIASPLVVNPNVLVVMNKPSYDKFIDTVVPSGTVIIDSSLISDKVTRTDLNVHYVPATELAGKNDLKGLANIILLGKLFEQVKPVSFEGLKKGVEKSVPPKKQHLVEPNMKAIELGMNYK